jgi:membrane-associated phospholipid phosphatase
VAIALLLSAPPAGASASGFALQPGPFADAVSRFLASVDSPVPDPSPGRPEPHVALPPRTGPERPPLPRRIGADLREVALAPLDWENRDWRRVGVGALMVGAAALLDDELDGWLDAHRSSETVRVARAIRPLGQEVCLALLGAAWVGGRHFDRPDLSAAAADGFEAAIIAAGVITPALKAVTARPRPGAAADSDRFGEGGQSFPSGETTLAFAVASVVAAHAEKTWIDVLAWSSAGLVGLQRMALDAHWASDVVAGALIGSAVGRWVVRRNNPDRPSGARLDVAPLIDERGAGVAVTITVP